MSSIRRLGPIDVALISAPVGRPYLNGSARWARELAVALGRVEGDELGRVRVFSKPGWEPPSAGIDTVTTGATWTSRRAALSLLLSPRVAVHHYIFAPHRSAALVARGVDRVRRARTVQTVAARPLRFQHPRLLLFGDVVVVPSRWSERRWIEAGCAPSRLRVLRPPLAPLERPSPERRRAARRALGLGAADEVLLFVGDPLDGGGLTETLEAFPKVLRARPAAALVVASRSKTAAGARALDDARRRLSGAEVGGRGRLAGAVRDFHGLLGAADLCLLPARDTFGKVDLPYAALEAMDLGVATLVGEGGALEELAGRDRAAAVAPVDADAIAGACIELLGDEERRRALGQRGHDRVRKICDPDVSARAHLALYREVTS